MHRCEFTVIPRDKVDPNHVDIVAKIPPAFFPIVVFMFDSASKPIFAHIAAMQRPS